MTQTYFDRTGRVRRPPYAKLFDEFRSLLFERPMPPDARQMPHGRDHVVLVIPAFLTGDTRTAPLRRFLRQCGVRAEGWQLGVNWGPTPRILAGLQQRLSELREMEQGPISVIGISMGGLLARDLAHSRPNDVRQVITLVSPWRLPTASTIEPVIHIAARFYSPKIDLVRVSQPLPMPATSIYTREDGIVAWQSCHADDTSSKDGAAVEVRGAHSTICRNPQAMTAVIQCLASGGGAAMEPRPPA